MAIKKLEPIIHYHTWMAYKRGWTDYDSALSSAYLGALKAIRKHNPRLSKLSTFAWAKIRGQIICDIQTWRQTHKKQYWRNVSVDRAKDVLDTRYNGNQFPYEAIREQCKQKFNEAEYQVADLILRGYKLKFIKRATYHNYIYMREVQNMLGIIIERFL